MSRPDDFDALDIQRHQTRIKQVLANKASPTFRILDTCRLDNGGILSLPAQGLLAHAPRVLAFVPAAGAASRYYAPLSDLISALQKGEARAIQEVSAKLLSAGAKDWPLPPRLATLLPSLAAGKALGMEVRDEVLRDLERPKALQPSRPHGPSFLACKLREHAAQTEVMGEVFVVPPGTQADFAAAAAAEEDSGKARQFLAQSGSMSTLRFRADGEPWRDEAQNVSLVPAGHGTLVKLFPQLRQAFPQAEALFIRNIDNVTGESQAVLEHTSRFLSLHAYLLRRFQKIRAKMATAAWAEAEDTARELWETLGLHAKLNPEQEAFLADQGRAWPYLWLVQCGLIHMQASQFRFFGEQAPQALLQILYNRPLNCLGQVPNLGKDIGGTPVFIDSVYGRLKLCIELPHVTRQDVEQILARAELATHFNPVFVAAEIVERWQVYDPDDNPFWIVANKMFRQEQVYYHETVLYELLGNNLLANCVFVEVPRLLFHPHKSLTDALGQSS